MIILKDTSVFDMYRAYECIWSHPSYGKFKGYMKVDKFEPDMTYAWFDLETATALANTISNTNLEKATISGSNIYTKIEIAGDKTIISDASTIEANSMSNINIIPAEDFTYLITAKDISAGSDEPVYKKAVSVKPSSNGLLYAIPNSKSWKMSEISSKLTLDEMSEDEMAAKAVDNAKRRVNSNLKLYPTDAIQKLDSFGKDYSDGKIDYSELVSSLNDYINSIEKAAMEKASLNEDLSYLKGILNKYQDILSDENKKALESQIYKIEHGESAQVDKDKIEAMIKEANTAKTNAEASVEATSEAEAWINKVKEKIISISEELLNMLEPKIDNMFEEFNSGSISFKELKAKVKEYVNPEAKSYKKRLAAINVGNKAKEAEEPEIDAEEAREKAEQEAAEKEAEVLELYESVYDLIEDKYWFEVDNKGKDKSKYDNLLSELSDYSYNYEFKRVTLDEFKAYLEKVMEDNDLRISASGDVEAYNNAEKSAGVFEEAREDEEETVNEYTALFKSELKQIDKLNKSVERKTDLAKQIYTKALNLAGPGSIGASEIEKIKKDFVNHLIDKDEFIIQIAALYPEQMKKLINKYIKAAEKQTKLERGK